MCIIRYHWLKGDPSIENLAMLLFKLKSYGISNKMVL